MIYAAGNLVNNSHKPASLYLNAFRRPARALLNKLHLSHSGKGDNWLSKVCSVPLNLLSANRKISYPVMSIFVTNILSFDYVTTEKSRKWKPRVRLCRRRLLLTVACHFRTVESSSFNRRVLGESGIEDNSGKMSLWYKMDGTFAQGV